MDEYRDAKARLFRQSKLAIINIDDENGRWIKEGVATKVYTYGIYKEADIYARDLVISHKGYLQSPYTQGSIPIELRIPGIFSVYNALAAASVCYALGISLESIAHGLKQVKAVNGRFELLDTGRDYSVILDYAHTPDGLENILKTAKSLQARLITLFGCGEIGTRKEASNG